MEQILQVDGSTGQVVLFFARVCTCERNAFGHTVFRSNTTCQPITVDGQQVCLSAGVTLMEEYVYKITLSRASSKCSGFVFC